MTLEALNEVFVNEFPGFSGFSADPRTIDVTGHLNGREICIMGYDHWCNLGDKALLDESRRQLSAAITGSEPKPRLTLPK